MRTAERTSSPELFGVPGRRPSQATTVHGVGRLYVRPGRIHGHIVEQVTVTAHAQHDSVYLDIQGTSRALCYQLTRQQFRDLAAVLDHGRPACAGRATPEARR
jgi:hypothetical protein